ncbi:MAG: type II secretion system protein [Lentisphaeria bacterium]|nr:type II secretion system protein [Lentisphaeria bacterium]
MSQNTNNNYRRQSSFTLIELLVVCACFSSELEEPIKV